MHCLIFMLMLSATSSSSFGAGDEQPYLPHLKKPPASQAPAPQVPEPKKSSIPSLPYIHQRRPQTPVTHLRPIEAISPPRDHSFSISEGFFIERPQAPANGQQRLHRLIPLTSMHPAPADRQQRLPRLLPPLPASGPC